MMLCLTAYTIFLIAITALYWSHSCLMYAHMMVGRTHLIRMVIEGRPVEDHQAIITDFIKDIDRVKPMPRQPWFYTFWVDRFSAKYDPLP